ncbi:HAD family phosphatase [filamentous cyanobacterium LEGE 11480]|uniref:HAD family phosphatase n=1 Tax=Romeriopsis navalis LEGE 11480 TaxID=2777977 RepID=A0A928VHP6_9CYAN|nr:Cof-type HAD-IIB family hydrolase [Romeriopsis navalis]MBE9028545.1 HAD family phosphatase [Romeriopsis navalis LEGE 11480]
MPSTAPNDYDIRLLVVDIDGTIAGAANQVSDRVLQALKQVQTNGIPVALATGRMYSSALRFHKLVQSQLPVISYQGAWIQDPRMDLPHQHTPLPAPLAQALLQYFAQPHLQAEVSIHLYLDDQLYVQDMLADTKDYIERSGIPAILVEDLSSLLERSPTKLLAMSQNTDLIADALVDLKTRYSPDQMYLTTSVATFLEAAHPAVNKGAAVQHVAASILGITPAQVMAIGDNCNDLEMLQSVGLGIAMGDAPDIVKAAAKWVAPDVEADGAAVAIEKFLLTDKD